MSFPEFKFPAGARFKCTGCGDCCRNWAVDVGPGEREALDALDWAAHHPALVGRKTMVNEILPGGGRRWRLARETNGNCIYLGGDNLCLIHRHFGGDAKPLLCRLFPFGFYPMGDAIAVDVSTYCKSVSLGQGDPLEARLPEWSRLLDAAANVKDTRRHRLHKNQDISGELVWEIEHHLLNQLADASMSLLDRVRCMLRFMQLGTTGDPSLPSARMVREAMARGIPAQIRATPAGATLDKTARSLFYQWLFITLNPTPAHYFQLPLPEQQKESVARTQAGNRFRDQRGIPWVDNRALSVEFDAVNRVKPGVLGDPLFPVIAQFLNAKILSQKFLLGGDKELPLTEALPKFLVCLPMTLWTARALAADRDATEVSEADVRAALRLIDRSLGQVSVSSLPKLQAKACDFVMLETDFVEAATLEVMKVDSR